VIAARVTLKLATSLDGRIATASGESRWITGELARREVHRLRAMHSCVLVGVETVLADDPRLDVRLAGYVGKQPAAAVLDTRQRIPGDCALVTQAENRTVVVLTTQPVQARLANAGVQVRTVDPRQGRVDPASALAALTRMVLPTVMIEGGGQVAASFLEAGLVDAIEWFRAPIILGDEGRPAVGSIVLGSLALAPRFKRLDVQVLGDDLWERYERLS
jgi:diaminohydroxyphosphoribosylaminopyrimidine deaminase / 5-amino-6-(5-phosphoribosylamino)uracil reductase